MELLKKLTQASAPSGAEDDVREIIKKEAEGKYDEAVTDPLGNLMLIKRGSAENKKKIMAAAHMDEIGVIAKYTDENGFVRFDALGGLDTRYLPGRRVLFTNGAYGVISCEEKEFKDKPSLDKLYIDTCGKKVNTGDAAVFCGSFEERDGIVVSKALVNRAGCYILLRALEKLNGKNEVCLAFTVQEEVGLRGAGPAAYSYEPDYAIAVDVTDTGDTPNAPVAEVRLGSGAAVKIMDRSVLCDAQLRNFMMETAKRNNIPYQAEIMSDGGTDAGRIHVTRAGIKTGGISVPVRYIHSPSETASVSDINNCIELLAATLNEL